MLSQIIKINGHPRAQRAHNTVLTATARLLQEEGLAALTIERIADSSGVSTATIYKHWPSKTAVAAEAFACAAAEAVPLPDSGDVLADLLDFAVDAVIFFGSPSNNVFTQLLAACANESSGSAYFRTYYLAPRRDLFRVLWDRALAKGVVRSDIDIDTAIDVLFGAAVFRLLRSDNDLDAGVARGLVRSSLQGLLIGTGA